MGCACTKIEKVEKVVDVIKEVPVTPLAYYNYDGKNYSVHSINYQEDEDFVSFLVCREPEPPVKNYFILFVHKAHLGKTLDMSNASLTNRFDYMISFEDTDHLYSVMYAPKQGTIKVDKGAKAGEYAIDINVQWEDKRPLVFHYSGKMTESEF